MCSGTFLVAQLFFARHSQAKGQSTAQESNSSMRGFGHFVLLQRTLSRYPQDFLTSE